MTDPTGMFAPGATTPNFYVVSVSAAVSDPGIAAMKFQTYVGDRTRKVAPPGAVGTGFEDTTTSTAGGSTAGTAGTAGTAAPPPVTFNTQAEAITPDPVSMVCSGTDDTTVTMTLANQGSTATEVTRVKVVIKAGGAMKFIAAAGASLYDSNKGKTSFDTKALKNAIAVAPGNFDFQILGLVPRSSGKDRTVQITIYLKDGSSRSITVQP